MKKVLDNIASVIIFSAILLSAVFSYDAASRIKLLEEKIETCDSLYHRVQSYAEQIDSQNVEKVIIEKNTVYVYDYKGKIK